ncbi:hypothetical protein JXB02_06400 [Candidatus Woesearchaeota archaeon]|nr:hypothetical protein [Candidatus Woesearchaeota archaeon]
MEEDYDDYEGTDEEAAEDDLDAAVDNDEMTSAEAGYQAGAEEYEHDEDEYEESADGDKGGESEESD